MIQSSNMPATLSSRKRRISFTLPHLPAWPFFQQTRGSGGVGWDLLGVSLRFVPRRFHLPEPFFLKGASDDELSLPALVKTRILDFSTGVVSQQVKNIKVESSHISGLREGFGFDFTSEHYVPVVLLPLDAHSLDFTFKGS